MLIELSSDSRVSWVTTIRLLAVLSWDVGDSRLIGVGRPRVTCRAIHVRQAWYPVEVEICRHWD
jgi:hypothetical protein